MSVAAGVVLSRTQFKYPEADNNLRDTPLHREEREMSGLRICKFRQSAIVVVLSVLTGGSAIADLPWQTDVRAALKQAKASGKPMMIQFTAEWCGYCHKMKATTFADPAVVQQVNADFIPVMLDADQHSELVEKLKLKGLPATVVVDPSLRILKKLNGYQKTDKLQAELTSIVKARRKVASVGYSRPKQASPEKAAPTPPRTRTAQLPTVRTKVAEPQKPAAFEGLCLVSLRNDRSLQRGNPKYSLKYKGATVSFATMKEMEVFRDDPELYWPRLDGECPVSARDGKRAVGRPEFGVMFRGEVWLFSSAANMNRFVAAPESFVIQ